MMHLVFMESEMVKEFYELKAEIVSTKVSRRAAKRVLSKYIDEFNSSTSTDEMYVLDDYIKGFAGTVKNENEALVHLKNRKKALKKELKSLGIKVK